METEVKYAEGMRAWVKCSNCDHEFFTTDVMPLMHLLLDADKSFTCKECGTVLDIKAVTICSIRGEDERCADCKFRFQCFSIR